MGQLDQGEWVLEYLRVPQRAILEHTIAELCARLYLTLVDKTIAYAHNGLLHFFCQLDASFEQRKVVLSKIEGVISHPEVVVQASSNQILLLHCGFFLCLGCTFMHQVIPVRILVLSIRLQIGGS